MKCVILQPSYIPWRGYFHLIQKADTFIFYDDVQFDKLSWRNRNRIKTANGSIWLSIPVNHKGHLTNQTPINEIKIVDDKWKKKHLASIKQSYSKALYFKEYFPIIEEMYEKTYEYLSDFTIETTIQLSRLLGLKTQFMRSSEIPADGQKTDRLISVLKYVGAEHYISGPAAKDYIEPDRFESASISLEYIKYNYPEYEQLHPPFDGQVSILDLLFMTGQNAADYIWNKNYAKAKS